MDMRTPSEPAGDLTAKTDGPCLSPTSTGNLIPTTMTTLAQLKTIYDLPLPELLFRAAAVHREHHDSGDIQRCALLSIKTGGCPEDCAYCPQSARYDTGVTATPLMSVEEVRERATRARLLGATRFCMGTAWR